MGNSSVQLAHFGGWFFSKVKILPPHSIVSASINQINGRKIRESDCKAYKHIVPPWRYREG